MTAFSIFPLNFLRLWAGQKEIYLTSKPSQEELSSLKSRVAELELELHLLKESHDKVFDI